MRSPGFIAIAVRRPDGGIAIKSKPFKGVLQKYPWLKKPVFRGVVTLFESMFQGIEALSYSAGVAAEAETGKDGEKGDKLSSLAVGGSIALAFVLGMALFVVLPHYLTVVTGALGGGDSGSISAKSPLFHLVDGAFKMAILLAYVYAISWMKDIKRVFQYHGAEHKSIYAFEAGEELTIESARKHTRLHPRCGTSFLLFLVLISILVFSAVFPLLGLTEITGRKWIDHALMVIIKIFLMLPVAGLSYEFIKICSVKMGSPLFRLMIWPGLALQNLTTREPDDSQLEVALMSLRKVLSLEKTDEPVVEEEMVARNLEEVPLIRASVAEFPEA